MYYSSEYRERKNSLCVKVKFTTNIHSTKEVFRYDNYNIRIHIGYAFTPIPHLLTAHHGVIKTTIKYHVSRQYVYRWKNVTRVSGIPCVTVLDGHITTHDTIPQKQPKYSSQPSLL